MEILELILSFAVGLALMLGLAWVFALKTKGFLRLACNSVAGFIVLLALNLFKIIYIPLNPLNGLIIGFLGTPGVLVVFLITVFL